MQSRDALRQVDAALARLVDGLAARRLRDRVDLVIVSDHGMAAVAPGHVIALEDMVPAEDVRVVTGGQSLGFAPYSAAMTNTLAGARVMRSLFIAHGPSFRRGLQLPPFDNADVYPLLMRLLGLPPAPHAGGGAALHALREAP